MESRQTPRASSSKESTAWHGFLQKFYKTGSASVFMYICQFLDFKDIFLRFVLVGKEENEFIKSKNSIFDERLKRMITIPKFFGREVKMGDNPREQLGVLARHWDRGEEFFYRDMGLFLLNSSKDSLKEILKRGFFNTHASDLVTINRGFHKSEAYYRVVTVFCQMGLLSVDFVKLFATSEYGSSDRDPYTILTYRTWSRLAPLSFCLETQDWSPDLIKALANDAKVDFDSTLIGTTDSMHMGRTFAEQIAMGGKLTSEAIKALHELKANLTRIPLFLAQTGQLTAELLSTLLSFSEIEYLKQDQQGNGWHHWCAYTKCLTPELANLLDKRGVDWKAQNKRGEDIVAMVEKEYLFGKKPDVVFAQFCREWRDKPPAADRGDSKDNKSNNEIGPAAYPLVDTQFNHSPSVNAMPQAQTQPSLQPAVLERK